MKPGNKLLILLIISVLALGTFVGTALADSTWNCPCDGFPEQCSSSDNCCYCCDDYSDCLYCTTSQTCVSDGSSGEPRAMCMSDC